tara:strand:- start:104 stop:406 length:303 start_codon:yes stop_codon:yes gene_type:complete
MYRDWESDRFFHHLKKDRKMVDGYCSVSNGLVRFDGEHGSTHNVEVDIMNEYDRSAEIVMAFMIREKIDFFYHSSSVDFADEADVDQMILDSFFQTIGIA